MKFNYNFSLFKHDLIAGITVGIVAVPLALALALAFAIASGVEPAISGFQTTVN